MVEVSNVLHNLIGKIVPILAAKVQQNYEKFQVVQTLTLRSFTNGFPYTIGSISSLLCVQGRPLS